MVEKEKYISEALMKKKPEKPPLKFRLGPGCVKFDNLSEGVNNKINRVDDLQNQIDSLEVSGMALSNEFGNDPHIGISQKTLTLAWNKLWEKLEDITGEVLRGISMTVTPTRFISKDGCMLHISANTVGTNGIFERIQFFVDGELIYEEENTEYVSFDHHIDVKPEYDYVIMCKAQILGIEYSRQQIVTRYDEFYIGAGTNYEDVMDREHARQTAESTRANYDISFNEGNRLFIVIKDSLRSEFVRADMNGVEIQFSETRITHDGKQYVLFTSKNTYRRGTYNIDING